MFLKDKDHIGDFLRANSTGVLSTASRDGTPHGSVIYYTVDATLNVLFLTKRFTRKSQNLRLNNRTVLTVYDPVSQSVAEVHGTAHELPDAESVSEAFQNALYSSLHTAHNAIPPLNRLDAGEFVAYRLEPDKISFANFNRRGSEMAGGVYEVVHKHQE